MVYSVSLSFQCHVQKEGVTLLQSIHSHRIAIDYIFHVLTQLLHISSQKIKHNLAYAPFPINVVLSLPIYVKYGQYIVLALNCIFFSIQYPTRMLWFDYRQFRLLAGYYGFFFYGKPVIITIQWKVVWKLVRNFFHKVIIAPNYILI